MEKFKKYYGYFIIILLCLVCLSPFLEISKYNRPSADDYDYSIITHQAVVDGGNVLEILKAAGETSIHFYNIWQGTYSSAFLFSLQPSIFGVQYYPLTTFIILGIVYFSLLFTINTLNKYFIKKDKLFVIVSPLVILTGLILWIPSIVEGLYWYNGAMHYMPFLFLVLVNIAILIEVYYKKSKKSKIILTLCSTVLSFFISGGNQVTAFANILILLIVNVFLLKRKKYYTISPLIFAILGFIIMATAPGTAVRQGVSNKQSILGTIFTTISYLIYLMGDWISIIWICLLLIALPIIIEIVIENKERFKDKFPIVELLMSIMIISGMLCTPYYAMGYFGYGRLTNIVWIMFIFLSWFNLTLILGWAYKKEYIKLDFLIEDRNWIIKKILIISISLIFLFIGYRGQYSNGFSASVELATGTAELYAQEMDERFELFKNESLEEVACDPLTVKPITIFFSDFTTDIDNWQNKSISEYYGKKIYIKSE